MAQREIKFRAWFTPFKGKKVFQGYKYGKAGVLLTFADMSPEQYEIEQYTGRKDYNFVDIYENDLAKFTSSQPGDEPKIRVGVVKFEDYAWVVTSGKNVEYLSNEVSIIEVIGNIHENPELLEAE